MQRSVWTAVLALAVAAGCGDSAADDDDDSAVDGGGGDDDDDDDVDDSADAGLDDLEPFSFFVTSLRALQELSGSEDGFGGDLRYGETGPGAGLRGADTICAEIAERSMPGSSVKQWRAFLSAASGEDGEQVNAIDRIGEGPWYDRLGRLFAPTRADALNIRPENGDASIAEDFPNEDGVRNHQPIATEGEVDNHDMLTGTDNDGQLYDADSTCLDWTANSGSEAEGRPRVGHSWTREGGPGGGGPGGGMEEGWMSTLTESGCAPGINLIETGPPDYDDNTVGSGGGYGGFYCFALNP